jgi:phage I-like protein
MRLIMTLLVLALAAPVFCQEPEREQPKMSEAAQKLYDDVEIVYAKYYEILLAKIKANEAYKADEVWETAVKEAKNAKYEDHAEFHRAITRMKTADRIFRREVNELITKLANDHAEAVRKWNAERNR